MPENTKFQLTHWPSIISWFQRTANKMTFAKLQPMDVTFTVCISTVQDGTKTWSVWTNRCPNFYTPQFHSFCCYQQTIASSHRLRSHTLVQSTRHQWDVVYYQQLDTQQTTFWVSHFQSRRAQAVTTGSREVLLCWHSLMTDQNWFYKHLTTP